MAKSDVRMLKCALTGKSFPYAGRGRPPKYCPEARGEVAKNRRAAKRKAD